MCILNFFLLNCIEKNLGIDIVFLKWIFVLVSNLGL